MGGLKKSHTSSKFQSPWTQSSLVPTSSLEPTSNDCPLSYRGSQGATKVAMPPKKGSSPFPKLSPKSIILPTYSLFPTVPYVPVQKVSIPSKGTTIKASPNPKGSPKRGPKLVGKIKNSLEPHSRSSMPSHVGSIYPTYTGGSHSALRKKAKGRFYLPSSTLLPKKNKEILSFHGHLYSSLHSVTYLPAPTGAAMNDLPPTSCRLHCVQYQPFQ